MQTTLRQNKYYYKRRKYCSSGVILALCISGKILIWRSGLAQWYTTRHCTLPLHLIAGLGYATGMFACVAKWLLIIDVM